MSEPKFPPMPTVLRDNPGGRLGSKGHIEIAANAERLRKVTEHRPPITHVAIRLAGVVWSLPRPYRHHHILNEIIPKYAPQRYVEVDAADKDQGFLDADGRFLTRKQAFVNADLNGQIKGGKMIGSILTSEDLW